MVHSTAANNPALRRYVAPNDGLLGEPALRHWNQPGIDACPHAFIGKLADGSVATYQTLSWTMRGWHCGRSANNTHISFEVCEDGLNDPVYFAAVYREAVELTAYLCREYGLDPLESGVVVCHAEGYQLGIASNHGDVLHWWPKAGKTMDNFRADVAQEMKGERELDEQRVRAIFREELGAWLAEQDAKQPTEPWQIDGLARAVKQGVTDGSRPMGLCTRLEAAMMAAKGKE